MDTFFIFGAKYLVFLSVVIFIILFWKSADKKRFIVFSIITFVLAYVFALIARAIYFDPRPFVNGGFYPLIPHSPDNGFVSDHTLLAASIAACASYISRRPALYLWLIAALVALSRVYVGVHHTIDVLASIVLAVLAAFIADFFLKKLRVL